MRAFLLTPGFLTTKFVSKNSNVLARIGFFEALPPVLLSSPGESHPEALRERNGKAVAVLIAPVDDDDVESLVVARSPRLQKLLNKSRASITLRPCC